MAERPISTTVTGSGRVPRARKWIEAQPTHLGTVASLPGEAICLGAWKLQEYAARRYTATMGYHDPNR